MTFTKDDLKTGMVVEFNNGVKNLVLVGRFETSTYGEQNLMFISRSGFMTGNSYDEHLFVINDKLGNWSVKKVYQPEISHFDNILDDCNKRNLIWERKQEVDWSKVPVDTKVLVRDSDCEEWVPRHFAKYECGFVYTFYNGLTSWSAEGGGARHWKYAKLAEGENDHE